MDGVRNPAQVKWSKWSACESSFSLLLVPQQPGVFALAEEIVPAGDGAAQQSKRMLAILEVGAADDLARSLSRLFAADSIYHQRLSAARCYVRYAVIAEPGERQAVAAALQQWLGAQPEALDAAAPAGQSNASPSNPDHAPRDLRPAPLPAGF